MRGPRARALSVHRPVTTTSAPSSNALTIGRALFKNKNSILDLNGKKDIPDNFFRSKIIHCKWSHIRLHMSVS